MLKKIFCSFVLIAAFGTLSAGPGESIHRCFDAVREEPKCSIDLKSVEVLVTRNGLYLKTDDIIFPVSEIVVKDGKLSYILDESRKLKYTYRCNWCEYSMKANESPGPCPKCGHDCWARFDN